MQKTERFAKNACIFFLINLKKLSVISLSVMGLPLYVNTFRIDHTKYSIRCSVPISFQYMTSVYVKQEWQMYILNITELAHHKWSEKLASFSVNNCTVQIWECIRNSIPHFIMDVITYAMVQVNQWAYSLGCTVLVSTVSACLFSWWNSELNVQNCTSIFMLCWYSYVFCNKKAQ